jgi:segregation and condensation protein A
MTYRLSLDVFEGPFDLLLYLIKKNEIDVYDIPIATLLDEFLAYVEMIKELDLDVAGDFILMGATLMHIKSRMLLPQESLALEEGAEVDPRADLVRQLIEYKRFKEVAQQLDDKERFQREVFWRLPPPVEEPAADAEPEAGPEFQELHLFDLLAAFKQVLAYAKPEAIREIAREETRTSQKMNEILDALEATPDLEFTALLRAQGTRLMMITAFLALLELARLKAVVIVQDRLFDRIMIRRVDEFAAAARAATVGMEGA